MKLLRTFPKVSFEFGLASWQWLGLSEQNPRFATCFGDIFLESLDGWWFLDTVEGTLELRWTSAVTMYTELESAEGRATYLMDDLVRDARSRGIHLGEDDVYTFNPHPALGGELGADGLGTMRFELAVNWVGQMHDQVLHNPGEIRLPPMPDDGRRTPARQVGAARDAAWSDDETFDVPFEQYLATTTFAAVSGPKQHDDSGYPPLAPLHGRPTGSGHVPHAAQSYRSPRHGIARHEAPAGPEQPGPTPPWQGQNQGQGQSASSWPGEADPAQPWPAASQAPRPEAPPESYADSFDPPYPTAPEQYGTDPDEQQPSAPYTQQDWLPYGSAPGAGSQDEQDQAGSTWGSPAWNSPTWGSPAWGGHAPAVAAGGSPQQAGRTDDPFTAWDDLWGKR
ncbi:T6SS immunity protein Tdi1 domain-containing protein [Promicromonospora sp. NPDC023987]|uniref:T6SS immunity protein Tdi1 domain-containing protein n=1 Tax=Promicromonospora sp. NPDC023987 TaxID=3155360 RepID=UPI0033C1EAE9